MYVSMYIFMLNMFAICLVKSFIDNVALSLTIVPLT